MSKRKARTKTKPVALHQAVNIPLEALSLSSDNVRTVGADDMASIAELAASIEKRSLLQSLMVRPILDEEGRETGRYEVPGGGRRLRALQLLAAQGRLAADASIPCIVKTDGMAVEDSLAENSDRRDLHPLDQYRAFRALRDAGRAIEDIAASFAVTAAVVRQRLRLADASPMLLDAYARDQLTLEQLMAYCVTTDTARQEQVFECYRDNGDEPAAWQIRRRLTEATVNSNDRRVRFVGLDTYAQAGGAVMTDLFAHAGDEAAYIQDAALLDRLVADKLAALREQVLAQGWAWCLAAVDIPYAQQQGYGRLTPLGDGLSDELTSEVDALTAEHDTLEEASWEDDFSDVQRARLDAVERRIAEISNMPPAFADEDKARAGVLIRLDPVGDAVYLWGLQRPEDRVEEEVAESSDGSPEIAAAAPVAADKLSDRLASDLTAFWTAGLQDALAQDADVAFRAVLHAMVLKLFYRSGSGSPLTLGVTPTLLSAPGLEDLPAVVRTVERHAMWQSRLPSDKDSLWCALDTMAVVDARLLFAHCAGMLLNAVTAHPERREPAYLISHRIAADLGFAMGKAGWVTGAASYFDRITKPRIRDAVAEACGADAADLLASLKKDDMAREAARLVGPTGWVPPLLRVVDVDAVDDRSGDNDLEPLDGEDDGTVPEFLRTSSDEEVEDARAH